MLYTITSLAGYPIQILHPFIGKSFPSISCLSLHGLHEESTALSYGIIRCFCFVIMSSHVTTTTLFWRQSLLSRIWDICTTLLHSPITLLEPSGWLGFKHNSTGWSEHNLLTFSETVTHQWLSTITSIIR